MSLEGFAPDFYALGDHFVVTFVKRNHLGCFFLTQDRHFTIKRDHDGLAKLYRPACPGTRATAHHRCPGGSEAGDDEDRLRAGKAEQASDGSVPKRPRQRDAGFDEPLRPPRPVGAGPGHHRG